MDKIGTAAIMKRSEELQKHAQAFIDDFLKQGVNVSYQDAQNVWLFLKMAEYELNMESLKTQTNGKDNNN